MDSKKTMNLFEMKEGSVILLFIRQFPALLLCKMNVFDIFDMVDFFRFFRV